MKTVNFSLKDSDGEVHQYAVELFSCDENARLQLIVGAPLLRMIAGAVHSLAPAIPEEGIGAAMENMDTMIAALTKINWLTAPGALLPLIEAIEARGGAVLVAQIFALTARLIRIPELENQPTIGDARIDPNHRQELKDPAARDQAFADGNMGEYWQAAAAVLIVNFTKYGRGGLVDWRLLASKLTGGILTPSKTETPKPKLGSVSVKG